MTMIIPPFNPNTRKSVCDTVLIAIMDPNFWIGNPELFTPTARLIWEDTSGGNLSCHCNPSAKELKEYGYLPTLTLSRACRVGGISRALLIQLSCPKGLFGNNLSEISDQDFPMLVEWLQRVLAERCNIHVKLEDLQNARVLKIHYGKNIRLTDGVSCATILAEIEKSDISKRFDSGKTDYKNGKCARIHTTHKEFALYDKGADILQASHAPRRAFDKNSIYQNLDLESLRKQQWLRLEVRLNNSDQIRQMLSKVGIEMESDDLTFANLFSSHINRKVCMHVWQEMTNACSILRITQNDPSVLFRSLLTQYKEIKALQLQGLISTLPTIGIRGMKDLLKGSVTARGLFKEIKNIPNSQTWLDDAFARIGQAINSNNIIKMKENNHDEK